MATCDSWMKRHSLSWNKITLYINSCVECSASAYGVLLTFVLFTSGNGHVGTEAFLLLWLVGEILGAISTFLARGLTIFGKSSSHKILLFGLKILGACHVFFSECGAAGFVGYYYQGKLTNNRLNIMLFAASSLQCLIWIIGLSIACFFFNIYWAPHTQKSLDDIKIMTDECCCHNTCMPILNRIYTVLFCPFYFTGHITKSWIHRFVFLPVLFALNIATILVRYIAFLVALILQLIGFVLSIAMLGLPCIIGTLKNEKGEPSGLVASIMSLRSEIWGNHAFKYFPAIIAIVAGYFAAATAMSTPMCTLICVCCCVVPQNTPVKKYIRWCWEVTVGCGGAGMGLRLDATIVAIPLLLLLVIAAGFLSNAIINEVQPKTVETATGEMANSEVATYAYIVLKAIQMFVQILLPIIRLIIQQKLKKLLHCIYLSGELALRHNTLLVREVKLRYDELLLESYETALRRLGNVSDSGAVVSESSPSAASAGGPEPLAQDTVIVGVPWEHNPNASSGATVTVETVNVEFDIVRDLVNTIQLLRAHIQAEIQLIQMARRIIQTEYEEIEAEIEDLAYILFDIEAESSGKSPTAVQAVSPVKSQVELQKSETLDEDQNV